MSFPPGLLRGPASMPLSDVQVFVPPGPATTVNFTAARFMWTKPVWATVVFVYAVGAGTGGGSGRKGATSTVRCGGGGGASGMVCFAWFLASDLPAQVPVAVGLGGAGGAAITTNSTDGNTGAYSGNSRFGSDLQSQTPAATLNFLTAYGGQPGNGGTASTGAAGGSLGAGAFTGGSGAAASTTGLAGGGGVKGWITGGGGSGGGLSAANAESAGGSGAGNNSQNMDTVPAGGAVEAAGQPGSIGGFHSLFPAALLSPMPSSGGGGGGSSFNAAAAGDGGAGGFPGSGGGGGGAALDTTTAQSGKGGDGAHGVVMVVSFG